eukprot:NODE_6025_length_1712_cov_4.003785.p1 GENE.NODE_6025_length_1712_cov_4.003785~~NODE_6025_length_1712_cov_4.003785.p1  ORF type:complete len:397 (+),score=102.62 NODE_6025_length_1712_cov_4.003785:135-1325(+)
MLAKGTPSKRSRPAGDLLPTPGQRARHSMCGGSPPLHERTPAASSDAVCFSSPPSFPTFAASPSRLLTYIASPQRHGLATPVIHRSLASTPRPAAAPGSTLQLPFALSFTPSPGTAAFASTLGTSPAAIGSAAAASTPARFVTATTPHRPCAWRKARDIREDVNTAIEEQSVHMLRMALQRRHPCPGEHALHEAICQAKVPALRLLLQSRAEPNARCSCLVRGCELPLQLVAAGTGFFAASDRLQAVELLLRAGAQPSPPRTDADANTPLHDAVRRGDFEVARALLAHGADPNIHNAAGDGPLHTLLRFERLAPQTMTASLQLMALALLRAGANPLQIGECAELPIALAMHPELQELLRRWSCWWRCRVLAWVRSRAATPLARLLPEILVCVGRFL